MSAADIRERIVDWLYPAVVAVLAIGLWETTTQRGWVAAYILPAPSTIVAKLWESRELLAHHTLVTAIEIVLGVSAHATAYLVRFEALTGRVEVARAN